MPSVVHYCAGLQLGHGFRCYGNIAPNAKCQRVLILALCLVVVVDNGIFTNVGLCSIQTWDWGPCHYFLFSFRCLAMVFYVCSAKYLGHEGPEFMGPCSAEYSEHSWLVIPARKWKWTLPIRGILSRPILIGIVPQNS